MSKKTYVSPSILAAKLGVSRQEVNNWRNRGLIDSKYDENIGFHLVELVDSKPTRKYTVNKK